MKKFAAMMVMVTLMIGMTAHCEIAPADLEVLRTHKTFKTEGELEGMITLSFEKNDQGYYPCVMDLGDGRQIVVPLTDDEVNYLMYKALEEQHQKAEEAKKEESDPGFFAKAVDFVTFWD